MRREKFRIIYKSTEKYINLFTIDLMMVQREVDLEELRKELFLLRINLNSLREVIGEIDERDSLVRDKLLMFASNLNEICDKDGNLKPRFFIR